jgi:glycosyltransferase involved in cell wall biosynthesis
MDSNLNKIKPAITILLPVHNEEKWLSMCLESIIAQSFQDFKCIVGFNGTRDKSKEIFDSICENDPRFIKIDYGERSGKAITLNHMLKLVDSEYTCLIDGDDIWHHDKLQKQIESIGDCDVLGTMTHYIDEKNQITNSLNLALDNDSIRSGFKKGHNQIINSSCMVKTDCFRIANGWDYQVEGLEDFDMWVKISNMGKIFKNLQEHLVYHRVHSNSNFNAKNLNVTIEDILIRNKIKC